MKKAVSVVLLNDEGLILAVSRKDNHNDFSFIGGKVDDSDNDDIIAAAIRETKEETGLDIYDLKLIYATHDGFPRMNYTFIIIIIFDAYSAVVNKKHCFMRVNKLVRISKNNCNITK